MMQTAIIKNYFTLAQVANVAANPNAAITWADILGPDFKLKDDPTLQTLLKDYIWPEYYNSKVVVVEEEVLPWELNNTTVVLDDESRQDFQGRLTVWLNRTYPVYSKLIELYKAKENMLLDDVSSTSSTLFNDTPQEGGNFDKDGYVTNATKTVSSSAVDTPIARLREVSKWLSNFYAE